MCVILCVQRGERTMAKTISLHNGTEWSRGHNIRDERFTKEQYHIDPELTCNNVVIVDKPVRQAYQELFGKSAEEYNSRQQRSDRKIDDYYRKIKNDKRKHLVYELIVQIGDRKDTGNEAEAEREALRRYAETWSERNPNLSLIGAYIHADEPNGTVHMHIDYIPVAHCDRGMRLQNSLDRALTQQGFEGYYSKRNTPQIAWQRAERQALEGICKDMGINAKAEQRRSTGRKHFSKNEYIYAYEKCEEALKPLREEFDDYKNLKVAFNMIPSGKEKGLIKKTVELTKEEYDQLIEQAKAYIANRSELDNLRKIADTLRKRKKELDDRELFLDRRENDIKFNERDIERDRERLDEMIEEQLYLNQRYSALKEVNSTLKAKVQCLEHEKNVSESNLRAFRDVFSELGIKPDEFVKTALSGEYDALTICRNAKEKIQQQINNIELEKEIAQLSGHNEPISMIDRLHAAKKKADELNAQKEDYDYIEKDDIDLSR